MFRLDEALNSHLIGPKTYDRSSNSPCMGMDCLGALCDKFVLGMMC